MLTHPLTGRGRAYDSPGNERFLVADFEDENGTDWKVLQYRIEKLDDAPMCPSLKTLKTWQDGLAGSDTSKPVGQGPVPRFNRHPSISSEVSSTI
jgi:hypothetical protein